MDSGMVAWELDQMGYSAGRAVAAVVRRGGSQAAGIVRGIDNAEDKILVEFRGGTVDWVPFADVERFANA